jgi:prepilin-type N-terminal cleavage/methylation domain-containing protein
VIIRPSSRRAFTLIEIMIVIGIIALVMTAGVPMMFRAMNKNPLTKAVNDVLEGCKTARDRAILQNRSYDFVIRPRGEEDYELQVEPAKDRDADRPSHIGAPSLAAAPATPAQNAPSLVPDFPRAIQHEVVIELLYVNLVNVIDQIGAEEARVRFYPNGTSDEFTLVLNYKGQQRTITVDIITGAAYEKVK